MPQVKGVVKEVVNGKTFEGAMGILKSQIVSIQSEDGVVKVDRSVKPENDGHALIGKQVQVTFDVKTIKGRNGDFQVNKTDSKRFIVLDADGNTPKPFHKGSNNSSTTNIPSGNTAIVRNTGYNSDGARHGMIVNNAVSLAVHREDLSLASLKAAARDVSLLTQYVESGTPAETVVPVTNSKSVQKRVVAQAVQEEEESPFNDE